MVDNPSQDILEKVFGAQPVKRRKKSTHSASISLEAHQPSSSSNHVNGTFYILTLCLCTLPVLIQSCSAAPDDFRLLAPIVLRSKRLLMNPKVISLAFLALMLFSFVDFFLLTLYCITFLFVVALNKALSCVDSLEAELKTTLRLSSRDVNG
jgi:hypothetical protein